MAQLSYGTRFVRWIKGIIEAILGDAENSQSATTRAKVSIRAMEEALDARSDAAAHAMATAKQTRTALEKKISEYEQYFAQAKTYAAEGDDALGKQSLLLAQQAEKEVVRLTGVLSGQQATADTMARDFGSSLKEVNKRKADLPALRASVRVAQAQERFSSAQDAYNIESEMEAFDEIASGVEANSLAANAKAELNRDPQQEMRSNIDNDVAQRSLDDAYTALKGETEVSEGQDGSQEPLQIEHTAVELAQDLLAEPRFEEYAKDRVLRPGSTND